MRSIGLAVVAALLMSIGIAAGQTPGAARGSALPRQFVDPYFHTVSPVQGQADVVPPFKIFDNLYYIGTDDVAAYVVKTSNGLIMIDSLFDKFVDHLVPALQQLGLNPKDVKYVIVTHGHRDHFGGAKQIQALSNARIAMAEADWQLAEKATGPGAVEVPRRDMVVKDGDQITLGDTTLKVWVTPGHTPGVVSLEFPVFDGGTRHKAFLIGGFKVNTGKVEDFQTWIQTIHRLMDAVSGVDVNLASHQWGAAVLSRAEQLKTRKPGAPHPFVAAGEFVPLLKARLQEAEEGMAAARRQSTAADRVGQ